MATKSNKLPGELPIPPAALKDHKAIEMIRTWVAAEQLHCCVNIGHWHGEFDEPSAWGILLADVVRHVANALEEEFGMDVREAIPAIRESFLAELAKPTSMHQGRYVDD